MIEVITQWEPYWEHVKPGMEEILAQGGSETLEDIVGCLMAHTAWLILDPENPTEFYLVTVTTETFHVWMGYSKQGKFIKRTAAFVEELANKLGCANLTFSTYRVDAFDVFLKRKHLTGYEKQPTVYRKKLQETNSDGSENR